MSHANANGSGRQYPDIYRNLMVVGLLGACYRAHDDAECVNKAVEATLADTSQYRLYRALAQGVGGDASSAAEQLAHRMDEDPQDDRSKVALALSLLLAGDPQWRPLIENVLATSMDQPAREAATNLIRYLHSLQVH